MTIRFWRRITLFPGVTLNISKTGLSLSFGVRGAHWTIGKRGHTRTVGIPGTGLFYRKHSASGTTTTEKAQLLDRDRKGRQRRRNIDT